MSQKTVVELAEKGPFIVKGLKTLKNSKGEEIPLKKDVVALCRCGESSNKPFCDGTHSKIDFSGERELSAPLDKSKAYNGEEITVHDNRVICSHAAECVNNSPDVFDVDKRPWIDPDNASADEVISTVKKCPSGALTYTKDGEHHARQEHEIHIQVGKDGPYYVLGGIPLDVDDDLQPPVKTQYALCRCGASKNKPYCDGTHHDIEFTDAKN